MADNHEDVEAPKFRAVRRGYQRGAVDRYVAELTARIGELERQREVLGVQFEALGGEAAGDLREEFEAIGAETGRILEAAREAAEGMRSRAAADAARWRADSDAESRAQLAGAREDAELLRGDAWETGMELLNQTQQEADRIRQAAEQDALLTRAEAEQEAHRLTGAARREADDERRGARLEAERVIAEARADSDQIVESARLQAESAQERARALEQRRSELLSELETARASIAQMESDLETRRESLRAAGGESEPGEGSVPVEEGEGTEWIGEERAVRIIAAAHEEPSEPVDAEAMAAEVQQLRRRREESPEPDEAEEPAEEPAEEEEAEAVEAGEGIAETPEAAGGAEVVEMVPEPEPPAEREDDHGASRAGGVIDSLFDELRSPLAAVEPEPAPPPEGTDTGTTGATAPTAPASVVAVDGPFELRDRMLLPITNRALRGLKRTIVDLQNVALEELRTKGNKWSQDAEPIETAMGDDVAPLAQEALVAGYSAATELVGADATPQPSGDEPADPSSELAAALAAAVGEALDRARGSGSGPRQTAAAVSRVFRAWRTDEAERRVRAAALGAYHLGLVQAFSFLGVEQIQGLPSGPVCGDCPAEGTETWRPGDSLPEGTLLPPARIDCACTIVPVT